MLVWSRKAKGRWLVANEAKSKQTSARQQTQRAAQGRTGKLRLSWVCLWGMMGVNGREEVGRPVNAVGSSKCRVALDRGSEAFLLL